MISFTEFVHRLGITLEPGQRVLCKVMFDRIDPVDLDPEERELAYHLFGSLARVPDTARTIMCLVAGGRSGKTYLFSLYMLYAALTVNVDHLAPGELAFGAIIAPSLDLAQQDLNYCVGAAESDPNISKLIIPTGKSELHLRQRPGGRVVAIRPFAASRGGVSGRGKSLISVLMSETCFFRDQSTGIVNDEHIFKAASPRVVDGGLTLVESTPWTSVGLLWNFYKNNFASPKTALVAHAPTVTMRNNPYILNIVRREYERDPDNARVEFGAEWGSVNDSAFFTDEDMGRLFDADPNPDLWTAKPGDMVSGAADLAFVKNSATLAILRAGASGVMYIAHLEEQVPTPGAPLIPSEVCSAFSKALKRDSVRLVVADGHYRETLREYTSAIDTTLLDSCGPAERLTALRAAIRADQVKVSASHPLANRLRRQLLKVTAALTPGGGVTVKLPKDIDGSHGDIADCLARAVWGMKHYGGTLIPPTDTTRWTPFEKNMEEKLKQQEADAWWNE